MRADMEMRASYLDVMRRIVGMSGNEARALEGLPRIDDPTMDDPTPLFIKQTNPDNNGQSTSNTEE